MIVDLGALRDQLKEEGAAGADLSDGELMNALNEVDARTVYALTAALIAVLDQSTHNGIAGMVSQMADQILTEMDGEDES